MNRSKRMQQAPWHACCPNRWYCYGRRITWRWINCAELENDDPAESNVIQGWFTRVERQPTRASTYKQRGVRYFGKTQNGQAALEGRTSEGIDVPLCFRVYVMMVQFGWPVRVMFDERAGKERPLALTWRLP